MSEIFANNATTTLGSAVGIGDTTITLATGTGALFPTLASGQWFSVTMFAAGSATGTPNEIAYCTARTGDTLTVTRAREGTSAVAWAVGDIIANFPTAYFYNNSASLADIQRQNGNSAQDVGTANAGVINLSPAPATLDAMNGAPIRIGKIATPNTGAYTLNVNGFGAKNVIFGGIPLAASQLAGSSFFEVVWDGTNFELISPPYVITNPNMAAMAAGTVKANPTGSPASPSDVTFASLIASMGLGAMFEYISTNASGLGQLISIPTATNLIYLPAGGSWDYWYTNNNVSVAGVGYGTQALFSGVLVNPGGWCKRIS